MTNEQSVMCESMAIELESLTVEEVIQASQANPMAAILISKSIAAGLALSGLEPTHENIRLASLIAIGASLGALAKVRQDSRE